VCILAGALFAFLLYRRDKSLKEMPFALKAIMAGFRFLSVTVIALLLLNPLLRQIDREIEKPVIIIAQDNSESILYNKDSVFYQDEYIRLIENLKEELADKFLVKSYLFGERVSEEAEPGYTDKQTDISELIKELNIRYSNRNVGALVLTSDGIYNKGSNPLYTSSKIKYPVYAVALGDTAIKKDLILNNIRHNRIVYSGNSFPVEITTEAHDLKNTQPEIRIFRGNTLIHSQKFPVDNERYLKSFNVMLEAKDKGLQKLRVMLSHQKDEVSYLNNEKTIFVDVLEGKQKVLILANAPHPDVAALKEIIDNNDNYEAHVSLAHNYKPAFKEFDLVILHQLPSITNPSLKLVEDIDKASVPKLFILGNQSSFAQFNQLNSGLTIQPVAGKFNDSQGIIDNNFSLFTISEALSKKIRKFPPLITPFGKYNLTNSVYPLVKQKIGAIESAEPLFLINNTGENRVGVITGEGLWRWRIADYSENKNHDAINELFNKLIQYLAIKQDKNRFRVNNSNAFFENEPVEFDAELYNDIYELINEPEVNIVIENKDKKSFPFVFNKTGNSYHLNAGYFPVGEYIYNAKVKSGDKSYTATGEFTVVELQIESVNTIANHQLLHQLSTSHGGEMVYPQEVMRIKELLMANEEVKPVIYTNQKLNDLINLKWVFMLLLFILSIEWFLRKRFGSY
jgi:hypothetical protein